MRCSKGASIFFRHHRILEKTQLQEYDELGILTIPSGFCLEVSKMKKINVLLALCLILAMPLLATGCGPEPEPSEEYAISDFFPFNENVNMVYEGEGNEFAAYTTYIDFLKGDRIQIRTNNGGTETVKVLENKDGELRMLLEIPETYYRMDLTDTQGQEAEIVLKEPLETGTSWSLPDGSTREITDMEADVVTPLGNYKAMEVTTTSSENVVKDYYAKDVGLIKTVYEVEGDEITSTLKEIVEEGTWDFTLTAYNYQLTNTDIRSTNEDLPVSLKTNEDVRGILETEFRDEGLMSAGTMLLSLARDEKTGMLTADFSKSFVTEMNAGTSKEIGVLSSVINTLGAHFQVQKVRITLEGESYSSGHIQLDADEYFEPKYGDEAEVEIED